VELIKTVLIGTLQHWIKSFELPVSVIKELERMFAKFLWRAKMHAWAWDKLCKQKEEGGLAIRRIQDINKAAGVKLVWRCCTSHSIWALWMRKQYVKAGNFWEARASLLDSGTWKFITRNRSLAKMYMTKNIQMARKHSYGLIHGCLPLILWIR